MTVEQKIEQIISKYDLLNHPFYQAWSAGTLPEEKLSEYTKEYGTFIQLIAEGWGKAGYKKIQKVEEEHFLLWKDFAKSLGQNNIEQSIEEVGKLNTDCQNYFQNKVTALGALLAFENQQPHTATSKLEGLQSHYKHLKADETYFEIHKNDWDEPALLVEEIKDMNDENQASSLEALEGTCQNLWNALSGILGDAEY